MRRLGLVILASLCAWLAAALFPVFFFSAPPPLTSAPFAVFALEHGAWKPYNHDVHAGQHVLILAHGVMENIASAYPADFAARVERRGRYDVVLGVSYDWSERTSMIAPAYAEFLDSLPRASIDIEAHSYGALQSIAAIEHSHIRPENVILLGAPLCGTPLAHSTALSRMMLRLPASWWYGDIGRFQRMEYDGAAEDLMPENVQRQALVAQFFQNARKHHTHVMFIAGSDRFRMEPIANLYLWMFGLEHWGKYMQSDGLIPVASALYTSDGAGCGHVASESTAIANRAIFQLRHADLRRDEAIQALYQRQCGSMITRDAMIHG